MFQILIMNYQHCICSSLETIFHIDTLCLYYPDMGSIVIEFKILIFHYFFNLCE